MTPTQPANTSLSFEKSAIPLLLALKPSRSQRTVTVFCHLAAIVAVFLASLPLAVQLLIAAVIVFSLHYNYRKDSQSQRLIWRSGNRWVIEDAVAAEVPAIRPSILAGNSHLSTPMDDHVDTHAANDSADSSLSQQTQNRFSETPVADNPVAEHKVADVDSDGVYLGSTSAGVNANAQAENAATGRAANTDSESVAAELHSIDFFSRWLVILTLHAETGRKHKFVIPYDSLSRDTFRLLRVRLRIEGFGLLNPDREY